MCVSAVQVGTVVHGHLINRIGLGNGRHGQHTGKHGGVCCGTSAESLGEHILVGMYAGRKGLGGISSERQSFSGHRSRNWRTSFVACIVATRGEQYGSKSKCCEFNC